MAERGCSRRRCWKRHILRQLQQRDRAQKALFLDLVHSWLCKIRHLGMSLLTAVMSGSDVQGKLQTDNKLLEKSCLLEHFTEKLQADSLETQTGLRLRPIQESADSAAGATLDPAQTELESLNRSQEGCIVQLQSINGELAYRMVEQNALLKATEATLEEQRARLASLNGQLSSLEAEHQQLKSQVEDLSHKNATLKEDYDTVGAHYRYQERELRRAAEKGMKVVQSLICKKAKAAEDQNKKIESAKQAVLLKELKKATKRTVRVEAEPEEAKAEEKMVSCRDFPEEETCEKLCKKPFRSASATSMTFTRYVDVFKGFFGLKRGNSISSVLEDRYCCIPSCVAACLPSRVSDQQESHLSEINAITFSPNSHMLATGGTDRLIRLWNVAGGRLENVQTLEGANGSVTSIEFDPSGCHVLAALYNNAAQLWKIGDCKFKEILTGHTDKVTAAKFKSTWYQAVTGSRDRTVKEWDLGKGACLRTINVISCCNDVVCCDTIIVSGHHDKTIRFWDSREPRCTQVIPVEGRVTSLSISPDQMHLLSCSRDNALKVIDLRMHNIRQVFRADGFKCGSDWTKAVFSPDKSYALAGSADGTLYLWNIETGKLEVSLPGVHRSSVDAVAWSPSGMYVGSVDRCRKLVLWR